MPTDIIFILDASGSIGYDNFERMKSFLVSLVGVLDIGGQTRVGLVQFSDNAKEVFSLNTYSTP